MFRNKQTASANIGFGKLRYFYPWRLRKILKRRLKKLKKLGKGSPQVSRYVRGIIHGKTVNLKTENAVKRMRKVITGDRWFDLNAADERFRCIFVPLRKIKF